MLATYAYDDLGRRTGLTFGNGAVQAYTYDPVSRLASLTNDLASTANDLSQTFAYNPASQIASTVRTGDAYAWTGHFNENKTGTPNGLNQLTQVGAKSLTHDARGNVTAFGSRSFTYSSENLLLTGPNGTSLSYDPVMRLQQVASGGTTTNLTYDGLDRIAEYDGSNTLQRRYVHGPSVDEPLVWYEGTGTTDRRFLGSDERGSIISVTDSAGTVLGLNKYDEYGNPQSTNLGVWGYTGQAWLPTVGVWYYKAREYDPELGRFLQTDPIGYADSLNLYAYALNDPTNLIDPLGLYWVKWCATAEGLEGGGRTCFWTWIPPDPITDGGWSTDKPTGGPRGGDGGSERTPKKEETSTLKNIWECTKDQYGFGSDADLSDKAAGGARAGSELGAVPLPKKWVGVPLAGGPKVSRFTNPISYIPFKLGISLNTGKQILGSGRVFGVLGRLNAPIGAALLAYDVASIAICTARK